MAKAEELIRRCIHPMDDIPARNLLDAERRWSYTVFLQTLCRYLDEKLVLGQPDAMYAYARASLVAYTRWMAAHEYPYLERPDVLEYPTETWAAQDMRKCDVFLQAARYTEPAESTAFRERAEHFHKAALDFLYKFESRTLARPRVLLLSYGYMLAAQRAGRLAAAQAPIVSDRFPPPQSFTPQKQIAFARAKRLAAAVLVTTGLVIAAVIVSLFT